MNEILPNQTSPQWSRRTKRTVALICLVVAGFMLWQIAGILPLLVVAVVIAYLLTPLVSFNEQVLLGWLPRGRRGLAVLMSFLIVLMLFILVLVVVLPLVFDQLEEFGSRVPNILANFEQEFERVLSEPLTFNNEVILVDGEPVIPLVRLQEVMGIQSLSDVLQIENLDLVATLQSIIGSVGGVTGPAFNFLGGAFNVVVNVTFLLVMVFYLTKDGDKFLLRTVQVVPKSYQNDTRRLFQELGIIWNGYLRGQLILCVTIGFLVFFAAMVLGLPNATILGLVAGLLEFIPAIGPLMALILAVLLALVSTSTTMPFLTGSSFVLATIVVYALIQNFEAYFLVPRVMGNNLNLHPFMVIVAVIAGASIAGALGVILAAPSLATLRLGMQYIYGKLTDSDPFPTHQPIRKTQTIPIIRLARTPIRLVNKVRTQLQPPPDPKATSEQPQVDSSH